MKEFLNLNEALTELPVRDNTEIDDFESEEGLLSCVDFAEYVPYCHLVLEERTSLNKNSNGESSSSCEPLVHIKRQSKSSLSSGVGGDVHASNIVHAKESSTAPKQGTVMQSLKKLHGKVYRNLERQYAVESKEEKFNLLRTPDGLHVLLISDILSVMKAEVSSSEESAAGICGLVPYPLACKAEKGSLLSNPHEGRLFALRSSVCMARNGTMHSSGAHESHWCEQLLL